MSTIRRAVFHVALALAFTGVVPLRAQEAAVRVATPQPTPTLAARADAAFERGEAGEALQLLEASLALEPGDVAARWRAARAAVMVGLLTVERDARNGWFRRAIAHADSALLRAPDDPDALRWALAANGNLALQTGPREAARASQVVWDLGHRILESEADDAMAHHALGTLHYEVVTLDRFSRFWAKLLLGGDALKKATWEGADRHLRKAVELAPGDRLYRSRYAQVLHRTGRDVEALAQTDTALALPVRTPLDSVMHARVLRVRRGIPGGG